MNNPKRNTKMREDPTGRTRCETGRAVARREMRKKRGKTEYDRLRGSAVVMMCGGGEGECEALCRRDKSLTTIAADTTLRTRYNPLAPTAEAIIARFV